MQKQKAKGALKGELPKSIDSKESSRVKASMVNDLGLTHPESLWHPIEEGEVSLEIEVHKFPNKVPCAPWAGSPTTDVALWEVDPVIDGLDSQQSKSQQESKGCENVDEC